MQTWSVLGPVADILTILAAMLAFSGAITSLLTRPRVVVSATSDDPLAAFIAIQHDRGQRPARNIFRGEGVLDENDIAQSGEGAGPWLPVLNPGDYRNIHVFDPAQYFFGGEPNERETRMPISLPYGLILDISWDHPVLPFLRTRRVVLWTSSERFAAKPPTVLRGRAANRAFRIAMQTPKS